MSKWVGLTIIIFKLMLLEHFFRFRTVYFHPMVSLNEFSVSSSVLRNRSLADDPNTFYEFKVCL